MAEDKDFPREFARETLQPLPQAEMTDALGAEPGERTEGRLGHRVGHYPRTLVTEELCGHSLSASAIGRLDEPCAYIILGARYVKAREATTAPGGGGLGKDVTEGPASYRDLPLHNLTHTGNNDRGTGRHVCIWY